MSSTLDPLREATRRLQQAWGAAPTSADLSRPQLLAVTEALGLVKRISEGLQSDVGSRISYESRPELGPQSLAKQQGFRTASQLIATTTGASTGEAARLVKVGEAIAPRLKAGDDVLIAAHGNSLRAIVKHLFAVPDDQIVGVEIPTGNPLEIDLDADLKPLAARYLDADRATELPKVSE